MTAEQLLDLLRTGRTRESSLIERKPDGFKDKEARKVIVAFANSTPVGQEAVLFVGLHDKTGAAMGVADADAIQQRYSRVLEDCYPEIVTQMHALEFQGKTVVAIVVPWSKNKPHFAGAAYVREGSRSVPASEPMFRELILEQIDKSREFLRYKRQRTLFSVRGINYRLGSLKPFSGGGFVEEIPDCYVEECSGHSVTFFRLDARAVFSESLRRTEIEFDVLKNRPLILITGPGRSAA